MRLEKLRSKMADADAVGAEIDGMLITDPLNRRYLTGFTGSAGWVLVTAEKALLAIDFRYYERAAREAPGWEQVHVTTTYPDALVEMVAQTGVQRVGFESDHVTVAQFKELREKLQTGQVAAPSLVPVEKLVLHLRAIKDENEIASISAAIACSDAAFAHLCTVLKPGMTEAQVSWELESHMRQHGASATAFPTIVGSGPNGAMPHATATERVIQAGEPIVIDFGAVVDGYCSDITRSFCLGQTEKRYVETWQLVRAAQQAVFDNLRPGMTGVEADALARDVFAAAGEAEAFGHGLGHGVGLYIHEDPRMGRLAAEHVIALGQVITVEPGLYYPGWGGVRIEDVVVVREDGVEVLTGAPKEPVIG
jgi:Xaa-Pro aminopeptidase